MSYLEIDDAKVYLLRDNTIKTVYRDGALINTNHLEKIRKAYTSLHGNPDLVDLKLVVVFEGEITFNQDVSSSYLNSRYRSKTAEALVVKCKKTKEYLKAVIQLVNIKHQIKIFSEEQEAFEWLEAY